MKQAEVFFRQGVEFSNQGDIAKVKYNDVNYREYYKQAYILEKKAALLMSPEDEEPMPRTWVMNSAASLAFKAGMYKEAMEAIAICRSFEPDGYISMKLDEVEELVKEYAQKENPNGPLNITGRITSANGDEKEIKIKDVVSEKVYSLTVPTNMFKEVVKSYWLEVVNAVAQVSPHGVFTLKKISKAA